MYFILNILLIFNGYKVELEYSKGGRGKWMDLVFIFKLLEFVDVLDVKNMKEINEEWFCVLDLSNWVDVVNFI